MAKQHINYETVSNPAMLERILNHLDEEIDEIRVLVNEIKGDYNSAVNSTISAASVVEKVVRGK